MDKIPDSKKAYVMEIYAAASRILAATCDRPEMAAAEANRQQAVETATKLLEDVTNHLGL